MKEISTVYITDLINGIPVNTGVPCHASNYANKAIRQVRYIVSHYTGNTKDAAVSNAKYFANTICKTSSHFFVDDDSIYQSVKLNCTAYHCGANTYYHPDCRNANSIGVEMCCTAGNYKISEKTKKNAAHLHAYLCKMLGITAVEVDTYVLRHYDVTHKLCPAQMAGSDNSEWAKFKKMIKDILNESAAGTDSTPQSTVSKTVYEIAYEVIAGKWGNGNDRKNRLAAAGYNYSEVQAIVNALLKK